MPAGTKVARCVADCLAKPKSEQPKNCYAMCQAATGQSYQTGRTTTKAGKKVAGSKSRGKNWYKKQYKKSKRG